MSHTVPTQHVLHVSSECVPYSKTGGLGDVVGSLPIALARAGLRQTIVTPRYRGIDPLRFALARRLEPLYVPLGPDRLERVVVYEGRLPGGRTTVYLLDHPYYDRDGYYNAGGDNFGDNPQRFALLARGALELMRRLDMWPDVVHAHDWQAGLAPLYAKKQFVGDRPVPATVFTIHNVAFRGEAPKQLIDELGLGWDIFNPDSAEFYDQLSYLKAGVAFADRVTTVSPRYAREILTPDHGYSLDGFLRHHQGKLTGILNGVDYDVWSPQHDPHLAHRYDAEDRTGKAACKAALQRELGLPMRTGIPVIGSISRITDQKGFDLIAQAGEEMARLEAQFVFLGSGDKRYEDALHNLSRRYPMKFAVRAGVDEGLAHRIEAGSDLFLMPSRYEPCGLNQLYSYKYWTIPIVRATGGLDDTVVDFDEKTRTGTGFKFEDLNAGALAACVKRAVATFKHHEAFDSLIARAMKLDYSWDVSARRYREIYDRLTKQGGDARRVA